MIWSPDTDSDFLDPRNPPSRVALHFVRTCCKTDSVESVEQPWGDGCSLSRVVYADRPRSFKLKPTTDISQRARAILSTKSARWVYEREWRLFSPHQGWVLHRARVVGKTLWVPELMRITPESSEMLSLNVRNRNSTGQLLRVPNGEAQIITQRLGHGHKRSACAAENGDTAFVVGRAKLFPNGCESERRSPSSVSQARHRVAISAHLFDRC